MRLGQEKYDSLGNLLSKGHYWFAWRPVKLITGEWIWWEWTRRVSWFNLNISVNAPHTFLGCWCHYPMEAFDE